MSEVKIQSATHGKGYRLTASKFIDRPRDEVFDFFSDAFQLETLTPDTLRFSVITPAPIEMYEGRLIDYQLKIRGIPTRWQSRITLWDPPHRFADEQMRGPYKSWYHEHIFEEVDGGTMCHDIVDYRVPGGALIHKLLVKRDLLKIFNYRQRVLAQVFEQGHSRELQAAAT